MLPEDAALLSTRMVRHPHAAWRALPRGTASDRVSRTDDGPEHEVIIVDPIESVSHFLLDDVSGFLWMNLDGTRSVEELVAAVCDEFEVDPEVARADVVEFIRSLLERRLVQEAPASP
jgi:hypothetical protein